MIHKIEMKHKLQMERRDWVHYRKYGRASDAEGVIKGLEIALRLLQQCKVFKEQENLSRAGIYHKIIYRAVRQLEKGDRQAAIRVLRTALETKGSRKTLVKAGWGNRR